jgi:hypothetical protein
MADDDTTTDWTAYFSPAAALDIKFIRDSWLASYRTSPWAGAVPNNLYQEVYTNAIDQLLARGAKLLVVRNPANKDLVIAWACFELTGRGEVVVHFAYTKPVYRRNGACRALLNAILKHANQERFFVTYKTAHTRYFKNATFRPEIARRKDSKGRLDS